MNRNKEIVIVKILLIVLAVSNFSTALAQAAELRAVVIRSSDTVQYQKALNGFQIYLKEKEINIKYDILSLESDIPQKIQLIREYEKNQGAHLVFAVGTFATETALKEIQTIPIVSGVFLRSEQLKKSANATGVYLEFSLVTELQWIKKVLPEAKTIGVLCNPRENGKKLEDASKLAEEMDLKLEVVKIRSPKDIPEALERLANKADVIWGVADKMVFNPQTAKNILLFSFRNRIPIIGLSSNWVSAGALFSLDRDYADIGKQCGEMATRILKGDKISLVLPAPPRKTLYSLNLKTARHMKVSIPEDLLQGAYHVF